MIIIQKIISIKSYYYFLIIILAVCERCGAIGVKHTFYTKSRRFCSMACARGELYSLVVNNKTVTESGQQHQQQSQSLRKMMVNKGDVFLQPHQQIASENEFNDGINRIKNANYRFRITDQSKITQINGFGESVLRNAIGNNLNMMDNNVIKQDLSEDREMTNIEGDTEAMEQQQQQLDISSNANGHNTNDINAMEQGSMSNFNGGELPMLTHHQQQQQQQLEGDSSSAAVQMYRDVIPQGEIPQIPKLEQLPASCPQLEKIISVRRKLNVSSHSYDWSRRLDREYFIAAPVTSFPHTPGYNVWYNIGVDMKVEVENTDCDQLEVIQPGQTPHSFWVATILNIQGYKALMRYEGIFSNQFNNYPFFGCL